MFLMGAPGGVGAGFSAVQAQRITNKRTQLEGALEKGWVTKEEGQAEELTEEENASRATRKAAFEKRLDALRSIDNENQEVQGGSETEVRQGEQGQPAPQEDEVQPVDEGWTPPPPADVAEVIPPHANGVFGTQTAWITPTHNTPMAVTGRRPAKPPEPPCPQRPDRGLPAVR